MLGAEIVLPPAAVRDSFAHYFSVYKEQNEVTWAAAPFDSLIDSDSLIDYWGQRGVKITKVGNCLESGPGEQSFSVPVYGSCRLEAQRGLQSEVIGFFACIRKRGVLRPV
jgi:hypothetical protein